MNVKIAVAVSALAVLLCSGGLRAQDAPPSAPPSPPRMMEAPPGIETAYAIAGARRGKRGRRRR